MHAPSLLRPVEGSTATHSCPVRPRAHVRVHAVSRTAGQEAASQQQPPIQTGPQSPSSRRSLMLAAQALVTAVLLQEQQKVHAAERGTLTSLMPALCLHLCLMSSCLQSITSACPDSTFRCRPCHVHQKEGAGPTGVLCACCAGGPGAAHRSRTGKYII